ncbi:hypothetical protein WJX72_008185 [[Myrmecia] bisecta]|uniref:Uncharacterized protein n=1 Tax=[Myrmecia] bisecta TaxID=41462 RepID=A0AAW1PEN9_9CHLO
MVHKGHHRSLRLSAAGYQISVEAAGPPVPWNPEGTGPEGQLARISFLPLHWFVHSLATPVQYSVAGPNGLLSEGKGLAHMEKNWGSYFPDAWVWGQGAASQVKLAFAGGVIPLGTKLVKPSVWVVGLRTESLSWDFSPLFPNTALFWPRIDACNGEFELEAVQLTHLVKIKVKADPNSFLKGLLCPTKTGFRNMSDETFTARVVVEAYERRLHKLEWRPRLLERRVLNKFALEFGGDHRCQQFSRCGDAWQALDKVEPHCSEPFSKT